MEWIIALWVYSLVFAYLLGSGVENMRLEFGTVYINLLLTVIVATLLWPLTLIWYGYVRISGR